MLYFINNGFAILLAVVLLYVDIPRQPAGKLTERDHAQRLRAKYQAKPEVSLWDGTRVDLLSAKYAIEVDFAAKWAEAIGQSLYYAQLTRRTPAIILLVKRGEDRFVYRCQTVCAKHGIILFVEKIE